MRMLTVIAVCAFLLTTHRQAQAAFEELAPLAQPYDFVVRVISLTSEGAEQHCSGAAVSAWHILTAAHCLDGATQTIVELADGQRIAIVRYLGRNGWLESNEPYVYDSVLLRLASPVESWKSPQPWSNRYLSDAFWSAGYPLGSPQMYGWSGTVDSFSANIIYQERAGRAGMSGSPLIHDNMVVGVHSHRLDGATAYAPVQQDLLDTLAADLRTLPAATPGAFVLFLPLLASN